MLSILIPTHNNDCHALIAELFLFNVYRLLYYVNIG